MTKTEKILLLITAVFFLLAWFFVPRSGAVRTVEPAFERPLPTASAPPAEYELYVSIVRRIDINHAEASELTVLPGVLRGGTSAGPGAGARDPRGDPRRGRRRQGSRRVKEKSCNGGTFKVEYTRQI